MHEAKLCLSIVDSRSRVQLVHHHIRTDNVRSIRGMKTATQRGH